MLQPIVIQPEGGSQTAMAEYPALALLGIMGLGNSPLGDGLGYFAFAPVLVRTHSLSSSGPIPFFLRWQCRQPAPLLAYLPAIEPNLGLEAQSRTAIRLSSLAILILICVGARRLSRPDHPADLPDLNIGLRSSQADVDARASVLSLRFRWLFWFSLPRAASMGGRRLTIFDLAAIPLF